MNETQGRTPSFRGVVESWNGAEGWGVVRSKDVPGGTCWVWHASIDMDGGGVLALTRGQLVDFDYELAEQDGHHARATRVVPAT